MDTNRSVRLVFIRVHSRFLFDRLWLRLCRAVAFATFCADPSILRSLRASIPNEEETQKATAQHSRNHKGRGVGVWAQNPRAIVRSSAS
jgi:hypothetical protein